jgi:glycine/D-amino acid oxidase-like deaminating enzyme
MRARHLPGLRMERLSADEVLSLEPQLSPEVCAAGGWLFPDGWFLNDPAALLVALARGFERAGGELRTHTSVISIAAADGGGASVTLDSTRLDCTGLHGRSGGVAGRTVVAADEVVIAAGAHSAPLVSASTGEFCPLDTERGYHVSFAPGSESLISRAVTDPSLGWIATPMSGGLRVAGKVELGGVHAPPSPARWEAIEAETRAVIDGLGARVRGRDWMVR